MEIPAKIEEEETFSGPREMVELIQLGGDRLNWTPSRLAQSETLLSIAKDVTFRRAGLGLGVWFQALADDRRRRASGGRDGRTPQRLLPGLLRQEQRQPI